MKHTLLLIIALLSFNTLFSQPIITLPDPQKTGGMPLMEALNKRSTSRLFDTKELTKQQLSNLLWASFGVTRPDGKRTAPSSMNRLETDIYVLLKQGTYLYDAKNHQLNQVAEEDIREIGGTQDFVKDAPVTLVLVADLAKMSSAAIEEKKNTANIDAGYISQNIYLYSASEGLSTGARGSLNREKLALKLKLRDDQLITIAQSVGYPKP